MICGPNNPSLINYTQKLPQNYYEKSEIIQNELRRRNLATKYSSETLIPVPGSQYFYELQKKKLNNNEIFHTELNVK
jgi:hypothetical protein